MSERVVKFKVFGVKYVINYCDILDWGKEVWFLMFGGEGFDIVIDVGGNEILG